MNDQTTAIQPRNETSIARVKNYLMSPEVKDRFAEMMGTNGIYYLNQVMTMVANDEKLQQCEPKSILISAMRAATLRLSVDPAFGQAWIVPYKGKANFQLGYKGVYELAQRTGLYRRINVFRAYEGEEVVIDRFSGMHQLEGAKKSEAVIGWMLYFKLTNGFEKTFYMSLEEIAEHAAHYSQAYNNPKSKWNDPHERYKMERKTVLMNGLRQWGRFRPEDMETIQQIEEDGDFGYGLPDEGDITVISEEEKQPRPEADILAELGYEKPAKQAENISDGEFSDAAPTPAIDMATNDDVAKYITHVEKLKALGGTNPNPPLMDKISIVGLRKYWKAVNDEIKRIEAEQDEQDERDQAGASEQQFQQDQF